MTVRSSVGVGLVAVAVVVLVSVAVAGPASAAPPPEAVCGVCGDGLADAAADAGVPLTVERGAATIRIREDGVGHWDARVRIDLGGESLALTLDESFTAAVADTDDAR